MNHFFFKKNGLWKSHRTRCHKTQQSYTTLTALIAKCIVQCGFNGHNCLCEFAHDQILKCRSSCGLAVYQSNHQEFTAPAQGEPSLCYRENVEAIDPSSLLLALPVLLLLSPLVNTTIWMICKPLTRKISGAGDGLKVVFGWGKGNLRTRLH